MIHFRRKSHERRHRNISTHISYISTPKKVKMYNRNCH